MDKNIYEYIDSFIIKINLNCISSHLYSNKTINISGIELLLNTWVEQYAKTQKKIFIVEVRKSHGILKKIYSKGVLYIDNKQLKILIQNDLWDMGF